MTPPSEDDSSTSTTSPNADSVRYTGRDDIDTPTVPGVVEWILGGLVAFAGLLFALAGAFLYLAADRERIETIVAADEFQVEGMTEPEFVDLTLSLLPWLAAGLLLTGLTMTALGCAFAIHRRRVRHHAAPDPPANNYITHALLGAVISAVTTFVPFSPVLGGGVAGYLERGDSERTLSVGAASGVLLSAPFFVVGIFVAAGLASGFASISGPGSGAMIAALIVVGGLLSLGFTAVLGTVGGWIGGKLAE